MGRKVNANDICRMVGSGGTIRASVADYTRLADFINDGVISLERVEYATTPEPAERNMRFRMAFGNHSDEHGWLKWWAFNFISGLVKQTPVRYEQWTPHGKADVVAEDLSVLAECGDTSPGYIITSLRSGHVNRFYVFPFSKEGKAYLFTVAEGGMERLKNEFKRSMVGMSA